MLILFSFAWSTLKKSYISAILIFPLALFLTTCSISTYFSTPFMLSYHYPLPGSDPPTFAVIAPSS